MKVEGALPPGLRGWWRRRQLIRQARSLLRALFADPANLAGTSLRRNHRGRCDLSGLEIEGGELTAFTFRILRHPRPYAFSRQFHEVVESYRYPLPAGPLERGKSINLTRLRGGDGEPSGSGL